MLLVLVSVRHAWHTCAPACITAFDGHWVWLRSRVFMYARACVCMAKVQLSASVSLQALLRVPRETLNKLYRMVTALQACQPSHKWRSIVSAGCLANEGTDRTTIECFREVKQKNFWHCAKLETLTQRSAKFIFNQILFLFFDNRPEYVQPSSDLLTEGIRGMFSVHL